MDQQADGIHSLYPRSLALISSTVGVGRVLLFTSAWPADGDVEPWSALTTGAYDKRRQPQFQGLSIGTCFPPADSMLSLSCKLNVCDAQFVRLTRMITDVHSFVDEIALLLIEMIRAGCPHAVLVQEVQTPMHHHAYAVWCC